MRMHLGRIAAVVALGFAGATAIAAPAGAYDIYLWEHYTTSSFNTPAGRGWTGPDGGAAVRHGTENTYHDGDKFDNGVKLGDNVTSLWNGAPYTTCFYVDHFFAGDRVPMNPWTYTPNLGPWNDKFSSHMMGC